MTDVNGNILDLHVATSDLSDETINDLKSAVAADPLCVAAPGYLLYLQLFCQDVRNNRNSRPRIKYKVERTFVIVYPKLYYRPVTDQRKRQRSHIRTVCRVQRRPLTEKIKKFDQADYPQPTI